MPALVHFGLALPLGGAAKSLKFFQYVSSLTHGLEAEATPWKTVEELGSSATISDN